MSEPIQSWLIPFHLLSSGLVLSFSLINSSSSGWVFFFPQNGRLWCRSKAVTHWEHHAWNRCWHHRSHHPSADVILQECNPAETAFHAEPQDFVQRYFRAACLKNAHNFQVWPWALQTWPSSLDFNFPWLAQWQGAMPSQSINRRTTASNACNFSFMSNNAQKPEKPHLREVASLNSWHSELFFCFCMQLSAECHEPESNKCRLWITDFWYLINLI